MFSSLFLPGFGNRCIQPKGPREPPVEWTWWIHQSPCRLVAIWHTQPHLTNFGCLVLNWQRFCTAASHFEANRSPPSVFKPFNSIGSLSPPPCFAVCQGHIWNDCRKAPQRKPCHNCQTSVFRGHRQKKKTRALVWLFFSFPLYFFLFFFWGQRYILLHPWLWLVISVINFPSGFEALIGQISCIVTLLAPLPGQR